MYKYEVMSLSDDRLLGSYVVGSFKPMQPSREVKALLDNYQEIVVPGVVHWRKIKETTNDNQTNYETYLNEYEYANFPNDKTSPDQIQDEFWRSLPDDVQPDPEIIKLLKNNPSRMVSIHDSASVRATTHWRIKKETKPTVYKKVRSIASRYTTQYQKLTDQIFSLLEQEDII